MANYRGHLFGGIVAYALPVAAGVPALLGRGLTPQNLVVWLLCSVAGALFPDIDIHSQGRKLWYRGLLIAACGIIFTEKWFLTTPLVALAIFPRCLTHRGLTHRWWFLLLAPLATAYSIGHFYPHLHSIAFSGALFFIFGAISHLILDYGPRMIIPTRGKRRYRK